MMAISLISILLAAQTPEEQDEQVEAYTQSNRVKEQHEVLSRMVGDWTAVQRTFVDPESPSESEVSGKGTRRFGGRFLFLEIEGTSMGRAVSVLTMIGYDVFKNEYLALALGENGTTMYTSRGKYDPSTRVLDLRGEMDDAFGKRPVRYTFRFEDEDTFVFDAYDTQKGEERRVVEIAYQRREVAKPEVAGMGGIFFKARNPEKLRAWYAEHLGIAPRNEPGFDPSTVAFRCGDGYTIWSPLPADTKYFEPSTAPFMFNYRVNDLDALLRSLREQGVQVDDRIEEYPYGRFAWIMDPEGNRVELWETPAR